MKKVMIALVLCAVLFAAGIEETVAGYYAANKNENIEEFMGYVDTGEMSENEIEFEREMVLRIWGVYDTDEYYIGGLEYSVDSSGEYAMAAYMLNATVSGAENFNYELDYVMLLHLVEGNWKVAYLMPYEEYVNMSEQGRNLIAIDYLAEEEYSLVSKPLEPANPTFDGKPPQDLSGGIESAVESCTSDAYCKSIGMGNCIGGKCNSSEKADVLQRQGEEACAVAFVMLGLAGILFAGRSFAF